MYLNITILILSSVLAAVAQARCVDIDFDKAAENITLDASYPIGYAIPFTEANFRGNPEWYVNTTGGELFWVKRNYKLPSIVGRDTTTRRGPSPGIHVGVSGNTICPADRNLVVRLQNCFNLQQAQTVGIVANLQQESALMSEVQVNIYSDSNCHTYDSSYSIGQWGEACAHTNRKILSLLPFYQH